MIDTSERLERLSGIASTARALLSGLVVFVREAAIAGVLGAWLVFWGFVIRSHYHQGEPLSAVVTFAVLIAPPIGFFALRVSRLVDAGSFELPEVDPLESG